MDILEQIEELQKAIADLKEVVLSSTVEPELPEKRSRPSVVACWACGGPTNASTVYHRYYCRQERGPCGIIRIYQAKGSKYDCDVSFQRTYTLPSGEAGTRLDVPSLSQKDMYLVTKGTAYNAKLIRQAMKGE